MTVEKAQAWKVGDRCPACGDELAPFRLATPAEFAALTDKENPKVLPARVDSAPATFVAEHGELHKCRCGYQSRVLPDAADDAAPAPKPTRGRSTNAE